jgi:hypothetical protein
MRRSLRSWLLAASCLFPILNSNSGLSNQLLNASERPVTSHFSLSNSHLRALRNLDRTEFCAARLDQFGGNEDNFESDLVSAAKHFSETTRRASRPARLTAGTASTSDSPVPVAQPAKFSLDSALLRNGLESLGEALKQYNRIVLKLNDGSRQLRLPTSPPSGSHFSAALTPVVDFPDAGLTDAGYPFSDASIFSSPHTYRANHRVLTNRPLAQTRDADCPPPRDLGIPSGYAIPARCESFPEVPNLPESRFLAAPANRRLPPANIYFLPEVIATPLAPDWLSPYGLSHTVAGYRIARNFSAVTPIQKPPFALTAELVGEQVSNWEHRLAVEFADAWNLQQAPSSMLVPPILIAYRYRDVIWKLPQDIRWQVPSIEKSSILPVQTKSIYERRRQLATVLKSTAEWLENLGDIIDAGSPLAIAEQESNRF